MSTMNPSEECPYCSSKLIKSTQTHNDEVENLFGNTQWNQEYEWRCWNCTGTWKEIRTRAWIIDDPCLPGEPLKQEVN